MAGWIPSALGPVGYVIAATVTSYVAILVFTRMSGLRSFATISAFDFAMTVAVGAVLPTTVLSGSVTVVEGIAAMATLFAVQFVVAYGRRHGRFGRLVDNVPLALVYRGEILEAHLDMARMTRTDVAAKLREHGIRRLDDTWLMVLETTGTVSVLPGNAQEDVAEEVLRGVRMPPESSTPTAYEDLRTT